MTVVFVEQPLASPRSDNDVLSSTQFLREAFKKKTIESLTVVMPTLDPPPPRPIFDRLRFFSFFQEGLFFFIDRVVE